MQSMPGKVHPTYWAVAWTMPALPTASKPGNAWQDTCGIARLAEVVSAAQDGKLGLIAD